MSDTSREVAARIFGMADLDQVSRVCSRLEEVMRSESMTESTAAASVSSLVAWFWTTLDQAERQRFEQLIEVNFELADKFKDELGEGQE